MQNRNGLRKRVNQYYFIKAIVNALLIILGAVFIALFVRRMQHQTTLDAQRRNGEAELNQVVLSLEENRQHTLATSRLYHGGNQDMLDDLRELLSSSVGDSLRGASPKTRRALFRDLAERSDLDYLFFLDSEGRVVISPSPSDEEKTLPELNLMSEQNFAKLLEGTRQPDGEVSPVTEEKDGKQIFYYAIKYAYGGSTFVLALGVRDDIDENGTVAPFNSALALDRFSFGNGDFLFAVNPEDGSFLHWNSGQKVLTGQNAREAGLSEEALQDGYAGLETIGGTQYCVVSKVLEDGTVICAASESDKVFSDDRLVLTWTLISFLLVMFLCMSYTTIVHDDFIRNAVDTKKIIHNRWLGSPVIFDISIFQKVFPLMLTGVLVIFGISFYAQTLLEISKTARKSAAALEEVTERYQTGMEGRTRIQEDHDDRYLAKARLIAYMLEEDPAFLNVPTDREYAFYNEDGIREYRTDDEGNRLRSVAQSARLQKLCKLNKLESIYVFDESGRTIATNTSNWFYTLSQDPEAQSWPFLEVLDGRKDVFVQEYQVNDLGENAQFIGVAFHYYTALDEQGRTVYLSRRAYEEQAEGDRPVTAHRSLLQVGLVNDLQVLTATTTDSMLSSIIHRDASFLMFDKSKEHVCLYSPVEGNIGMTASEIGVPAKVFSPKEYYGFHNINGAVSFLYSNYQGGEHIAALTPRSAMYQSRLRISLSTALVSLLLILLLSENVALTTEEVEALFSTINDRRENRNFVLFNLVVPAGNGPAPSSVASRWGRRLIPWREKTPEQKLATLISFIFVGLVFYFAYAISDAGTSLPAQPVLIYIISGNWDRGFNIFALTACAILIVAMSILIMLLRIPLLSLTSLLGTNNETVGNLLLSVVKYGGTIATFFFCLYVLGMDPSSLLASAGVLSLVIGLGAQSLIKDILAGIFFVFDGDFRMGDIVTIGNFRGTVVDIGLRTTKIRANDGNIKIFNNSEISGVLNMTKESSLAVCQIGIEYGQDIDYVEAVLRRELPGLRQRNPLIIKNPIYKGVQTLGESSVTLLIHAPCSEQDVKTVTRYLNREVLKIFYRNHIQVPFPNVTVSTLNMEGRRTIADIKESAPDISAWWDQSQGRTKTLSIKSLSTGMEPVLKTTEQLAAYHGLSQRAALQLRLLAEELFSLLRGISGDVAASFWIVVKGSLYELHLRSQLHMTQEIREQLLSASSSGKNDARLGYVGSLHDKLFMKLLQMTDSFSFDGTLRESPSEDAEADGVWSMSQYRSDLDGMPAGNADAARQRVELEKSILARLSDEVKVSLLGVNVEITVYKDFDQ